VAADIAAASDSVAKRRTMRDAWDSRTNDMVTPRRCSWITGGQG
jgi:hypothetical protein